jgi:hypothetical protein
MAEGNQGVSYVAVEEWLDKHVGIRSTSMISRWTSPSARMKYG